MSFVLLSVCYVTLIQTLKGLGNLSVGRKILSKTCWLYQIPLYMVDIGGELGLPPKFTKASSLFFFFFCLFVATLVAYGGSLARG